MILGGSNSFLSLSKHSDFLGDFRFSAALVLTSCMMQFLMKVICSDFFFSGKEGSAFTWEIKCPIVVGFRFQSRSPVDILGSVLFLSVSY